MFANSLATSILLLVPVAVDGADQRDERPASPAEQYQALVKEYEEDRRPRAFAPRFLEFAEENAISTSAVDALVWVIINRQHRPEAVRAVVVLERDHLKSEQLAGACRHVARLASPAAEKLLRAALDKSSHASVRSQACFHLAALLENQMILADQLRKQPDLKRRAEQYYGKDLTDHLRSLDVRLVEKKREQLYQQIVKSYADVPAQDGTMGEFAQKALFSIRHLSVGRVAPEINGEDLDGAPLKLSDYRGQVVMLSFWGHW